MRKKAILMSKPLVSVVIPTYNRHALLVEALQSVLAQTYENLEIIVIDDGSTDGTGSYVRGLESDRVSYVTVDHTGSPGAARNEGIKRASGKYIAFLDSDDWWTAPHKTEVQVEALESDSSLDFVASDWYNVPAREGEPPRLRLSQPEVLTFAGMLRSCPVNNSSVLIRKEAVDAVGLQDETLATCQDREYWLRVLRRRDRSGLILPEPLAVRRRHDGNRSAQDVVQCDRLSEIFSRHRDYDEALIDSALKRVFQMKVYTQAVQDLERGEVSLPRALVRRQIRPLDRLRLVKRRIEQRRRVGLT
jgi:glycosyltransferase involved in cell wall biosynthesis